MSVLLLRGFDIAAVKVFLQFVNIFAQKRGQEGTEETVDKELSWCGIYFNSVIQSNDLIKEHDYRKPAILQVFSLWEIMEMSDFFLS